VRRIITIRKRRTMLGFTGNLVPSNEEVFVRGVFCIEGKCDTGEWLYSTASGEYSIVDQNKLLYGLQGIDILVPLHALSHAPHRSCPPCPRRISDSNIKLSLFANEVLEKGKIVCPED
jgi:hypothetical protein